MIDSLEECFLPTHAPAQLTFTLSVSLLRFSLLLANFAAKVRINFDRLRRSPLAALSHSLWVVAIPHAGENL